MAKVENFIGEKLAINGGERTRKEALPTRRLFEMSELEMVTSVFQDSWDTGQDFGFQGKYEELYTKAFVEFQGEGGYADAVSSGTAALLISLMALDIPADSEIIFSPVTDPGGISPALFMGMKPVIVDSFPNSFNIDPVKFTEAITSKTRAAVITHSAGVPAEMDTICEIAGQRGIHVIEDCSQAHGAIYKDRRVGCFGDIAFFSTMFSKAHASGGCGGIVYTKDRDLYWRLRGFADRGKPFHKKDTNFKDPGEYPFYSLNFNQDEISCAIGLSTLKKLQDTINKRLSIIKKINSGLKKCKVVKAVDIPEHTIPSPFFLIVQVDCDRLSVSKVHFAEAIRSEGIWINPDYRYVVSEWGWMKKYVDGAIETPNASAFRKKTFNILFNERFSDRDIDDIINSILKVESVYAKG